MLFMCCSFRTKEQVGENQLSVNPNEFKETTLRGRVLSGHDAASVWETAGKGAPQTRGILRITALAPGWHLSSLPGVFVCAARRMTVRRIALKFRLSDMDQIPVV
jgi:hypothetical protein